MYKHLLTTNQLLSETHEFKPLNIRASFPVMLSPLNKIVPDFKANDIKMK